MGDCGGLMTGDFGPIVPELVLVSVTCEDSGIMIESVSGVLVGSC